jgi:hypothetical protein
MAILRSIITTLGIASERETWHYARLLFATDGDCLANCSAVASPPRSAVIGAAIALNLLFACRHLGRR